MAKVFSQAFAGDLTPVRTEDDVVLGASLEIAAIVRKMKPGDSLHIERHEQKIGADRLFTLTAKEFNPDCCGEGCCDE